VYQLGVQAFLAIVRSQSVSRAAEELHLAQSTVSKRLQVLEQELGTILIDRGKGNRPLRLTQTGEDFIQLAERWETLWRESKALHSSTPQLSLCIGSLDSMNYFVFNRVFPVLSQHEPKLNLRIITSHSPELYSLLEKGVVDVAFTLLRREHPSIAVERYHSDPMVGMCLATAVYSKSALIHPHELAPDDELFVYWGQNHQVWHDQWWNPAQPARIILDTAQLVLSLLSTERQWAVVPLSFARFAQRRGEYHIFRFSEPVPDRICYKITRRDSKASTVAAIKIFDYYFQASQRELN
jgi:DNA-binding transcriptional LysR family regulator